MLRSPTKLVANTPSGVGADSSRPYPNIIKYTYSRHKIRVSVSPHTHIHIINYVFLHHQIHISISSQTCIRSPFRGGIRIRGHDKSDPYGCERFTKTLLTDCKNAHNGLPKHKQHKHKNTTIVHHPTVTYFIKHTYSLTLIHIIYNIMHIFNCLREHLDNTKTAETYLNINLLKICKRLIFFTL